MRDPLGRLFPNLPRPVRVALDWFLTIAGAIVIVLALKAYVVNPYRIPSSSMEPTLHCARPAPGCEAGFSDRARASDPTSTPSSCRMIEDQVKASPASPAVREKVVRAVKEAA